MMNKKLQRTMSMLLLAVLIAAMVCSVSAMGMVYDLSRKGSVTVTLKDTAKKEPVPGGTLEIIPVCTLEKTGLRYTEEFADCTASLADPKSVETAKAITEYAQKKAMRGTAATVDGNGTAVFADLPLGMYMIAQTAALDGYEKAAPFLVTVPVWDEAAGEMQYDVNATPKCDGVIAHASCSVPFKKTITETNGTAPKDAKFTFQLIPAAWNYPMPAGGSLTVDSATGAATMTVTGAGNYDFGTIRYGLKDAGKTFSYQIREIAGSDTGFVYDTAVGVMNVSVVQSGDQIVLSVSRTLNGKAANEIVFNNTYNHTDAAGGGAGGGGGRLVRTGTRLPQTGLLWWPVPVLLMLGMVLMGYGYIRNRRNKIEEK